MSVMPKLNYRERFGAYMQNQREAKRRVSEIDIRAVLYRMPVSGARRQLILEWLVSNPSNRFLVNHKYCIQVKKDADLQQLLKLGKVRQVRIRSYKQFRKGYKTSNKAETYLEAAC